MRPVNGDAATGAQQQTDLGDSTAKRANQRTNEPPKDTEASEETQSVEGSTETRNSSPRVKIKKSEKEKPLSVAPHSTSYDTAAPHSTTYDTPTRILNSTKPTIRAAKKRDDYKNTRLREEILGEKGLFRHQETNLAVNHPNLRSLQIDQRKKALVAQANSAGGHLRVSVKDKNDAKLLADVSVSNPGIRSLKLVGNFGGRFDQPYFAWRDSSDENSSDSKNPAVLDEKSLRQILNACKHIEALDLKGCRLDGKAWQVLADALPGQSSLLRLELSGGDSISQHASDSIYSILESQTLSLKELVIDDLWMDFYSFSTLLNGMQLHRKFTFIKLQNISKHIFTKNFLDIQSLFGLCACNPNLVHLSLAGTKFSQFSPANQEINSTVLLGMGFYGDALAFNRHSCLRILDLSDCGLNKGEMSEIVTAAKGNSALIAIRTNGNELFVGDRSALTVLERRNRQLLEKQASAALDLLADHSAHQIAIWPRELSDVLVQNTPSEILPNIAAVIDTRDPEKSSGASDSAQSPKKQ